MAESIEHYARTVEQLMAEHRILTAVEKRMKEPIPGVRRKIRAAARATLPSGGGLNAWVAKIGITAEVRVAGSRIRVRMRGGRNSSGGRTDTAAIDRGRVRAPSWGHRTAASWHTVTVAPGFFTDPVTDLDPWIAAADRALDDALEVIR